ncbi:MAG TPA: hypothetical protein VH184_23470 [Dongiaceae bacterium]|jgi:hypothetical protein|nr:hypothetical protein [Dongiaceae bacterium]
MSSPTPTIREGLPELVMKALLGAISEPGGGIPSREQIERALKQLAHAAAAICRVMPNGSREKFEMFFAQQCELRFHPNEPIQGQEEDE